MVFLSTALSETMARDKGWMAAPPGGGSRKSSLKGSASRTGSGSSRCDENASPGSRQARNRSKPKRIRAREISTVRCPYHLPAAPDLACRAAVPPSGAGCHGLRPAGPPSPEPDHGRLERGRHAEHPLRPAGGVRRDPRGAPARSEPPEHPRLESVCAERLG